MSEYNFYAKKKPQYPPQQVPYQPREDLVDRMRKWLLIGLTSLVAGAAVILIIISIIGKVF